MKQAGVARLAGQRKVSRSFVKTKRVEKILFFISAATRSSLKGLNYAINA